MLTIAQYLPFLQRTLTPKRLEHSIGVMGVMEKLAEVYALDRERAITSGLLHDAGKELTPVEYQAIVAEAGIVLYCEADQDYNLYLHGPVSAYVVQRDLGISDPIILDAITSHTFYGQGANLDPVLVWCLRFSDLLEPNRNWSNVRWLRDGLPRLREAAFAGRLAEAAFLQSGWLIEWFEEAGMPVHPNMRQSYREFAA